MRVLYCIVHDPEQRLAEFSAEMLGIEGAQLECFSAYGLTAVTSTLRTEKIATDTASLLSYQQVIDSIFQHNTLIPMRFGTLVKNSQQLREHLADKRSHYQSLLAELADCVEMGVRILYSDIDQSVALKSVEDSAAEGLTPTGREFLARRKAYYFVKEQISNAAKMQAKELQTALQGLYVKYKIEARRPNTAGLVADPAQGKLISAYFLVQRDNLNRFKAIVQQLPTRATRSFTLSGPWPPYNFVVEQTDLSAAGGETKQDHKT